MKLWVSKNEVVNFQLKDTRRKAGVFQLEYDIDFGEKSFSVVFDLTLTSDDKKQIKVVYKTDFITDSVIDDEFKGRPYPYVNGPAISYPFLRAFIATITVNSGIKPILLPSINFLAKWENEQKKKDK